MKNTAIKKITQVLVASFILCTVLLLAQPITGSAQLIGGSSTVSNPSAPPITYASGSSNTSIRYNGTYCTGVQSTLLGGSTVADVLKFVTCLIEQSVVPLLFALATAAFVWGGVKFISAGDSAEKESGQQFMLWGIIAIAVMFSVWGLVNILNQTFGIRNVIPQLPQ